MGVVLSLWVVLLGSGIANADSTDDLIATVTKQSASRAEAAKKLLAAAESLNDLPEGQIRLYEKACEYGMTSPSGYSTVLAALDLLETAVPQKISTWRDKRLDVYRGRYYRGGRAERTGNGKAFVTALLARAGECEQAGDWADAAKHYRNASGVARTLKLDSRSDILEKIRVVESLRAVHARIAGLKGLLAKNPSAASARKRLVMIYVVDLDSPHEAAKHLGDGLDATLRKNVTLASKEAAGLADADFLTLGQWYKTLALRALAKGAKTNLLTRARDNLNMYLEVYTKQDITRLEAVKALKAVEAQLKALSASPVRKPVKPPAGKTQWINLLAGVNPDIHGISGEWSGQTTGLLGDGRGGHGAALMPVPVCGSYDLQLVFTLVSGDESDIILPVGAGGAALYIGGWRGRTIGLGMIDGMGANGFNNPTRTRLPEGSRCLQLGARNVLDVAVRTKGELAQVTARLNGRNIIDWSGRQSSLTQEKWCMSLPPNTIALVTFPSQTLWHAAKLRLLDPADRNIGWVSRDATFKLSSVSPVHRPLDTFVTGLGALNNGCAIRTAREMSPYVIIQLRKSAKVTSVFVVNGRSNNDADAKGLRVWTSARGRTWQAVGLPQGSRRAWMFNVRKPAMVRYVKIGLVGLVGATTADPLALAGVKIYATAEDRR